MLSINDKLEDVRKSAARLASYMHGRRPPSPGSPDELICDRLVNDLAAAIEATGLGPDHPDILAATGQKPATPES